MCVCTGTKRTGCQSWRNSDEQLKCKLKGQQPSSQLTSFMLVSQLLGILKLSKFKYVSARYVLKFLLLELKQDLIQGISIACIIHKVRLDNQNNFFRN